MLKLNLRLSSMNVPNWLKHKTRSEEVEELPDYLQVEMTGTAGLSFLNYGSTTPTPDNAIYPWLKLDATGNVIGLFYNKNGVWTIACPSIAVAAADPSFDYLLWLKVDGAGLPLAWYLNVASVWKLMP